MKSEVNIPTLALQHMVTDNKQVREQSLALSKNAKVAEYLRLSAQRILEDGPSNQETVEDDVGLSLAELSLAFRTTRNLFKTFAPVKLRAHTPSDWPVTMAAIQAIELMGAGNEDVGETCMDFVDDADALGCLTLAAIHIRGCGKNVQKIESVLAWLFAAWTVAGAFNANAMADGTAN
jgi:hypothetical protein